MSKRTSPRQSARIARRRRVRKRIQGTDQRPRLCVFRSLRYTYAQLVSDESNTVLAAGSTKTSEKSKSVDSAKALGASLAAQAKEKNIETAVFDRNGYLHHGRVAAVAEGAREGGLTI